ncbi:outer membrane protein assembly factor BamB family protein [Streptacidiphilus carbonis]|uniref:outer membrane protein assembly factor BamB family protein n=1 Tax=Streptacidiphilus carbonis TaxID=105422 RepID=UPI0005A9BA64|nr:PQQ-binding-like beta-propeller repeat protein [Streptacidiphilus carbonis]
MAQDPTGTGQSPDYVQGFGQGYDQDHGHAAFPGSDPAYQQASPEWPAPDGQQQYWPQEGYGYQAQEQQQFYAVEGYAQQPYPQQEYAQQGYPRQEYPQHDYGQQAYADPQYPDPQYPDPQYAQQGYPQGYQQQGYQPYPEQPYQDASGYYAAPAADYGIPAQPTAEPYAYVPEAAPAEPTTEIPTADPSAADGSPAAPGPVSGAADVDGDASDDPAPASTPAAEGTLPARLLAAATGRTPGTDRRTFLLRAAIGAVALVVVVAAGVVVAGQGSSSGSRKTASGGVTANLAGGHTKAWAAPADTGAAQGNDGLLGSWLLAKALVRGDGTAVTAYDAASGSKLWTVAPPSPGAVPCAMSATVNSAGIGAVLFQAKAGTGQACTQLVAVDTATGQQKWKATIATSTSSYGASVMVSDTRAVAVGDSAVVGYDIATGKQSWTYAGPGKYCGGISGSGTGSTLLVQSTCADSSPKQQAISLNADTGKLAWWRGLPANASSYTVLSASPAVVAVHQSAAAKDSIMSFSDKGDTQATIYVTQTAGTLDSTHGSFDPDPALFFTATTMVAELNPPKSTSTGGVLTAFTLADGKQLWQTAPREKGNSALVGIDGGDAVVATEERIGQPARLSHFDLATGKETPGGGFPQNTGSLLTSGRILYRDNLVVALPEFTSTYSTAATAFTSSG